MPLIEGIGDEVTHFFILVAIFVVGIIAWQSTGLSDRQIIRTVLILERRTRHRLLELPVSPPTNTTSLESNIDTGQTESQTPDENQEDQAGGVACSICDKENTSTSVPASSRSSQNVGDSNLEFPEAEPSGSDGDHMNSAGATTLSEDCAGEFASQNDSTESGILRRRRLAFFQSRQATLLENPVNTTEEVPSTSTQTNENISHQDDISVTATNSEEPPPPGNIRIRLKYLNDDQKLVEGKLQEQLGDFKRRHFQLELSGNKLVRLIFNGHVLQSDSDTLQDYGLFDNCVVHCLVHQQRTAPGSASESPSGHAQATGAAEGIPQREWDLGNILFASLSLVLGLAWYCRYQYAQLFNATTTVALVGLTGILTISLVGIYLPDQDGVRQ